MTANRPARAVLLSCALALGSACAEGATARGMTVTPDDLRSPTSPGLAGQFAVSEVGGGTQTNPMWTSQIDDASFREALVESLRAAGLLSGRPDAPLAVEARLVKLDQPMFGLDMTVTSIVHYTVKDVRSGAMLIDEDVTAQHTAKMGEAFVGATRLKLANEGSARKNIAALIERLKQIRVAAPSM
ncbi:MAG TPA: hypothetical protein VIV57_19730 [Anaeromyxobacter sp.]